MKREVRLERSMLFVPAMDRHKLEKAAGTEADAICIDLEDAVTPEHKSAARTEAVLALQQIDFGRRLRILRINDCETGWAYRDLIDVVEAAGEHLDLVMVPKVGTASEVEFVERLLRQIELSHSREPRIGLEVQIETAKGYTNLREIAGAGERLEALIFGPGDFAASMGMPSSGIGAFDNEDAFYPGHRWHAVMQAIVAASRTYGMRCLDGPYGAYRDSSGFERSCRIARSLGFDGKQCIHPGQLAAANQCFTPTEAEIAHAGRILAAYAARGAEGRGAISVDGKMVDAANLRLAQEVAERARNCGR